MRNTEPIRCRLAACREVLDDGKKWSIYLINDCDAPLDLAILNRVSYEWGEWGSSESVDARVANLAPAASAMIWRDDGGADETRMELLLLVRVGEREVRLAFEFPQLYRKTDLPLVVGLGKPGWQESAVG